MNIIAHRRNTLEELKSTPRKYGIEIDIRSTSKDLILHHDPFSEGVLFDDWILEYRHQTLILNVKEDGLEPSLIKIMEERGIEDYFFLDQPFPAIVKWANAGERNCAVRVSEFEPVEMALCFSGKIDWVWIDSFTHFPLSKKDAVRLKEAKFKLYLVSPELQGRHSESGIRDMAKILQEREINADAICTKYPELWESLMK